jgi:hypothetical protein
MVVAYGVGDRAWLRGKRGIGGIHVGLYQPVSYVTGEQVRGKTFRADVTA